MDSLQTPRDFTEVRSGLGVSGPLVLRRVGVQGHVSLTGLPLTRLRRRGVSCSSFRSSKLTTAEKVSAMLAFSFMQS